MIIQLPRNLHFPITITAFLKQPDDEVPRLSPLLRYTYRTTVTEYPEFGEELQVEKELSAMFNAPVEGRLERWMVSVGTVIKGAKQDHTHFLNKDRATIHLVHSSMGLTVSQDEASRLEEQTKRRLLEAKKLSLVVDLDQTIIHATVDPTVGEWKDDVFCVNHESVKDVQAFKLDEDIIGGRGTWYYVKMRPGLKEFLEHISKLYELHIYTMGTRAYAMSVKRIVDPDGTLFGERVLSRDESGSMTQKSLQRLFPVDTKMVVIIDDRGDVWKWSDNLVKVRPYDFFVGIGDINSSFLPKRQELAAALAPPTAPPITSTETEAEPALAGDGEDESGSGIGNPEEGPPPLSQVSVGTSSSATQLAALDQLVTIGGDDENLLTVQSKELDKALNAQKADRPLAKKQEEQDKKDEIAAASVSTESVNGGGGSGVESTSSPPSEAGRAKHSVLHDHDVELFSLEHHLTQVHKKFFDLYEKNQAAAIGRASELRGDGRGPRRRHPSGGDLTAVPDIKVIMPTMKMATLGGVVLVFSGVIPLGLDVHISDIAYWAKSFGAIVVDHVHSRVTHLVAARSRTAKVRTSAAKFPHIKIVSPQWLYNSISNWQKESEEPYLIDIHPEDRPLANGTDDSRLGSMSSDDEDFEDIEDEEMRSTQTDDAFVADDLPDMANVGWMEVDEEFQEWIGSDTDTDWLGSDDDGEDGGDDDDDEDDGYRKGAGDDSALSSSSLDRNNNGKRSRGSTLPPEEGLEDDTAAAPESRLKKRLKISKERPATGLRGAEAPASKPNSASPSPGSNGTTLDGTTDERGEGEDEYEGGEEEEEEEDDLAAEFEREFLAMEALDEELAAQGEQTENDGGGNGDGNGNGNGNSDSAAGADGDSL